jgi:multidrug efflux pump subunit AcrA (membrane-fusion protein)
MKGISMKKKLVLIPLGIIIFGFIIMMILQTFKEDLPQAKALPQVKFVNVEVIQLESVPTKITGYGRLVTSQPVILYSEVNGTLVSGNIPFQPAQSFKKGNLLLKIDDRQIRLDLNSAKSDFLNALASVLPEIKVDFPDEYQIWQAYFNNCDFDKIMPSLPHTDNQKIKLFLSRFNVYKLYFLVRNLEIQLEKHFFYAPFDGSILIADVRVGSTARIGMRLGEIINLEKMEVEVPVPASDVQWIDYRKSVKFTSSEISGEWAGKVQRVGKNIDTRTQTVQVFIDIGNSHKEELFNGVFLKVEIPGLPIANAVAISRGAIYNENYVYTIKEGRLVFRKVNIARTEMESVIINEGLVNNDTLVVDILQGVTEGMPAKIKSVATN